MGCTVLPVDHQGAGHQSGHRSAGCFSLREGPEVWFADGADSYKSTEDVINTDQLFVVFLKLCQRSLNISSKLTIY